MQQVLINLISNALKFSRAHSVIDIKLKVNKVQDSSDEIDLQIDVVD